MSLVARILIRSLGRAAARRFEAATRRPRHHQERKLMEILRANRDTEYGREHGFGGVRSLRDWRRAAPVVDYEDIRERMEQVVAGRRNVFTAEDPVMFARTSGTTGAAKYIPVTPTCRGREQADQMRTWLHHAGRDHPGLFKGKVLSLVSRAEEGRTPGGIPYGSTSGQIYRDMPRAVQSTYAVPYEVFEIEDYAARYYALMRLGLACPVSFLSTANPSSVLKMVEVADAESEALIRDVRDGTLREDLVLEDRLRRAVEARCRPDPSLASGLEAARRHRGGRLLPADYWPHLQLIGCWKGGTVGAHVDRFPGWFDPAGEAPVAVRDWGYLSSEARGSIPLWDEGSGGVLTVATNVYEFIPAEQVEHAPDDRCSWTFLDATEVETGREYYVLLTTTGGLYRYDINDVVEVVGRYNATPVIAFRRKGRGMTSITGEKVSVNQVIQAFQEACEEAGVRVDHFKAEADMEQSRYTFKVETAGGVPQELREPLLRALDRHLAACNIEYAAKRRSRRLNPPELHVMPTGWYDETKRRLIAQGKRLFQAKTVILDTRSRHSDAPEDRPDAVVPLTGTPPPEDKA